MRIKCTHCEEIYLIERGSCPACGKQGGFMQEPSIKEFDNLTIHLEEILIHIKSLNEYKVKEIQGNGLIAFIYKTGLPVPKNKNIYISNNNINEYKRKL